MGSWIQYIQQLHATGHVRSAVIGGHDGTVWGQTKSMNCNHTEVASLVTGFDDADHLRASGILLGGEKFMFLRADESMIVGKKGAGGLIAFKTRQAVIAAAYDGTMSSAQCSRQLLTVATVLRQAGL